MQSQKNNAFTLVELLIVGAVLAGLASLMVISFIGARSSARDSQRKSDTKQYQSALEQYANRRNNLYPSTNNAIINTNTSGVNILCNATYLAIANCPNEPQGANPYEYSSNGTGGGSATATQYVLWARLERAPLGGTVNFWVICSNGRSGCVLEANEPTNSTCPALTQC